MSDSLRVSRVKVQKLMAGFLPKMLRMLCALEKLE